MLDEKNTTNWNTETSEFLTKQLDIMFNEIRDRTNGPFDLNASFEFIRLFVWYAKRHTKGYSGM